MKRTLRLLAIAAAAGIALLLAASGAIYFLVDFDRLVSDQVAKNKPAIEAAVGRPVAIGGVGTRFFPTLAAHIEGIEVGDKGDGPPLFTLERAEVRIALWRAILSLGKRIEVSEVSLVGPVVRVERSPDGSLSIDDLLQPKEPTEEEAPAAPGELPDWLQNAAVSLFQIRDGAIHLVDRQAAPGGGVQTSIEKIELRVRDISLARPIRIDLGAAVASQAPNFEFRAAIGPVAPTGRLPEAAPPVQGLSLRADRLNLAPFAPYLGEAAPRITSALLSAKVEIPRIAEGEALRLAAELGIAGLQLEGGEAFDLGAATRLELGAARDEVDLEHFRFQLGEMAVEAKGRVEGLDGQPRFHGVRVHSDGLTLDGLLAYLPMARQALPPGSRLSGPLAFEVKAAGDQEVQQIEAKLDLGQAEILLPDSFSKPRGTALGFALDAQLAPGQVELRQARFDLAELGLVAKGKVENFAQPRFDLTLQAAPFSFDSMVRLAPQVGRSLQASGARAEGRGALQGHLKGSQEAMDLLLQASLLGARLSVPEATVEGDLRLELMAKGNPAGDLDASFLFDGGKAVVRVPGKVEKDAATPLRVDLALRKAGSSLHFQRFDFQMAELKLAADGALQAEGESRLRLRMPRVDLEKLARTFPALPAEKLRASSVEGEFALRGNPEKMETLVAEVTRLSAKLGASDLQMQAKVENPEAPRIEVALHSNFLDVDALRGEPADEEDGQEAPPREDDPELRKIDADLRVNIQKARVSGRDLSRIAAHFRLRDGHLQVEEARFEVYGGSVSAAQSEATIWKGKMPFRAKLEVRNLDVAQALRAETEKESPLSGRATLSVDLRGEGFEREDLERHLTGGWSAQMQQGRFSSLRLTEAVMGDLASLPAFAVRRIPADGSIRNLRSRFHVEKGKMQLVEPMVLQLDGSKVTLDGAVGIFGELFLEGAYLVPGRTLGQLSGGRCKVSQDLAVPVAITGPMQAPQVRPDGKKLAGALAEACLKQAATELVEKYVPEPLRDIEDKAAAAKAEAEAKARKAAQQAKAEAERRKKEAEAKARAEAEKRKKEAEKKAKQKAKEVGSDLKKRLGF